jgi:hypothetical protein
MRTTLTVLAVCLLLAGCGGVSNNRDVGLRNVPLPRGAQIAARVRSCDRGANAYCSEQLVVIAPRFASSADLLNSENARLHTLGWTDNRGNTGKQLAAQSPGNEYRLYFNTAYNDLLALDMGYIHRSAPIGRALSAAIFDRAPAISVMLVRGSS